MNKIFILIIPRFEDIFHSYYSSEIIKGVSLAASRLKVDLLIHITDRHKHEDWLSHPMLNPKIVDGVIFGDINGDRATLKKVVAKNIPYIVMNNYFDEPFNCIAINNLDSSKDAVNYLVGLGHRRIATIAGDLTTQAGKYRLRGYKEALNSHKIPINDKYIKVGSFMRTPAREAAEKLLRLKDRPTAVFAASDVMALELMDLAKKQALRIPQDLSVVGFDDNPIHTYSSVELTTIGQPLMEMGRLALENLNQIVLRKANIPFKMLLPTKLIKRDSCAMLKSKSKNTRKAKS